jgi:RNA polymerase sigma factor (sigma-70 family)
MTRPMSAAKIPLEESCPGALPPSDLGVSRALLARAQGGDASALNELFARYYERLRRIVTIRLGPEARRLVDSGDIVQETFQAALAGLVDLRVSEDGELLRWFARVAENRIRDEIDRQRAQKRGADRERPLGVAPETSALADGATEPPDAAYKREVRAVLDRAIAELSAEYREAVLLRDFCGADWETIARRLGRESIHAAQQLHQRAWIKLRRAASERLGGAA